LQVTQRILHILGDNTAETQEETYNRKFYCTPNYWIPEEEQFSNIPLTLPVLSR